MDLLSKVKIVNRPYLLVQEVMHTLSGGVCRVPELEFNGELLLRLIFIGDYLWVCWFVDV